GRGSARPHGVGILPLQQRPATRRVRLDQALVVVVAAQGRAARLRDLVTRLDQRTLAVTRRLFRAREGGAGLRCDRRLRGCFARRANADGGRAGDDGAGAECHQDRSGHGLPPVVGGGGVKQSLAAGVPTEWWEPDYTSVGPSGMAPPTTPIRSSED